MWGAWAGGEEVLSSGSLGFLFQSPGGLTLHLSARGVLERMERPGPPRFPSLLTWPCAGSTPRQQLPVLGSLHGLGLHAAVGGAIHRHRAGVGGSGTPGEGFPGVWGLMKTPPGHLCAFSFWPLRNFFHGTNLQERGGQCTGGGADGLLSARSALCSACDAGRADPTLPGTPGFLETLGLASHNAVVPRKKLPPNLVVKTLI